jgi:hypothetical protein
MRDRSRSGDTRGMRSTTPTPRVILDAVIDRSVIRGTLSTGTGERHELHGWLELDTLLEGILSAYRGALRNEHFSAGMNTPRRTKARRQRDRSSLRSLLGANSQRFAGVVSAARRAVRPVRDRWRDAGGMTGLRPALLVVLVLATAALNACGRSSASSSSTASISSTASPATGGSAGGLAAAKHKCLDVTKMIQDSGAWSAAEQACNQITTGNANITTALGNAKQACLTGAAMIPIASLNQTVQAQCNTITAR